MLTHKTCQRLKPAMGGTNRYPMRGSDDGYSPVTVQNLSSVVSRNRVSAGQESLTTGAGIHLHEELDIHVVNGARMHGYSAVMQSLTTATVGLSPTVGGGR